MHQGYLAIFEKEISEGEIFDVANEMLQEDFIEGDSGDVGYALRDPMGDWLEVGGRYYDMLMTDKESEEALIEQEKKRQEAASKNNYKDHTMNMMYASRESEEQMCRKHACQRIDKDVYNRILSVKEKYSDILFLDYVNEKVTEKTPSFKSIQGHWLVIVDIHS